MVLPVLKQAEYNRLVGLYVMMRQARGCNDGNGKFT